MFYMFSMLNMFCLNLNGYHDNIEFTLVIQNDGKLPFLDVLIIRKDCKVETTVYRKSTNNNIYLGSRFPQQHGNEGRYRHYFQEP